MWIVQIRTSSNRADERFPLLTPCLELWGYVDICRRKSDVTRRCWAGSKSVSFIK
jgi:hypothetical protein